MLRLPRRLHGAMRTVPLAGLSRLPALTRVLEPSVSAGLGTPSSSRSHYKFAKPPSPNLDALRKVLTERLVPVHFFLRNNLTFTNYVWDKHFIGICCSPKFEGKSHKEMNELVDDICDEVGMKGRVRLLCHPPSRWHMMKRRSRKKWDFDW
eukprot:TRINITY_DN35601_c0_g1_i1.p1 TRINITY_DN35601_c0_g1~~TRINITY_DN35601_c0_g1_i1.p1  ORF type:complete len:151 (+),score=17.34 TRINITY_DN35601_c0_g1_i1:91-543(+)